MADRERPAASREVRLEEALRGLMAALIIDKDGNLTGGLDQWADAWCKAVEVLDVS